MEDDDLKFAGAQTKAVHASGGQNRTHAVGAPIWQTATFRADSSEHFAGMALATKPSEYYTRYGNPTHEQVEATLSALEGGEAALVASSGMGAIFASVMSHLQSGDHVVAQRNLYAGTNTLLQELLPRFGIERTFVDPSDTGNFATAIRPQTKLIYLETPTNPLMQITDLRAVAALARERKITTIVDNTFSTPINQRPLELGCDAVVHSATKYLGGHHDLMA
ncbi:MAG TPA: PLP-dependent aspartate aminotransferase family protein, partial [Pyrinomonadaceae bacterium]|nr:PLP-dependent aspartate aminotransferase family protein [Pyrinomonadaceae bacterium]